MKGELKADADAAGRDPEHRRERCEVLVVPASGCRSGGNVICADKCGCDACNDRWGQVALGCSLCPDARGEPQAYQTEEGCAQAPANV